MQTSRVSMTIAPPTPGLSAHQPSNTSHTGRSSPFVETTAPLTTAELEGNGNSNMASGLNRSLPNQNTRIHLSAIWPQDQLKLTIRSHVSKCSRALPTEQQLVYIFCSKIVNSKQITQDTWTLQTIQGYKIPFCRRPGQWRMRVTSVKRNSDVHHTNMAIKDLLTKGAVRENKLQDDHFTSTQVLLQKENGDYWPIINLRALNRRLGKESFKMEGLQVMTPPIQQGDFIMKLDLKDAYYTLPIHSHRKFLRSRSRFTENW